MKKCLLAQLLFSLLGFFCIKAPVESDYNYDIPVGSGYEMMTTHFAYGVIKDDGSLWTWGLNFTGILGDGTLEDRDVPNKINIPDLVTIEFDGGLALAADIHGDIWYWGKTVLYLEPDLPPPTINPVKISKLAGTIDIEIFSEFILLKDDGTVWYLDWNYREPTAWLEPKRISGVNNVKMIDGALALGKNGTVAYIDSLEYPVQGPSALLYSTKNVTQIQHFYNHRTVILKDDSTVWAWGYGQYGQLGNGLYEDSDVPVQAVGLDHIVAISTNYEYNLALKADGTVWYWGYIGQNDEGVKTGIATPVQVPGLDNVIAIHANPDCMIKKRDGSYWTFSYLNTEPVLEKVL